MSMHVLDAESPPIESRPAAARALLPAALQYNAGGALEPLAPAIRRTDALPNPYLVSRTKRAFDVAGAAGILLLLLPVLAMVALLIAATSRGPVLFRQTRCGLGGRPFTIFKFRSMYVAGDGDPAVVQAKRSDPRVTPIGRFIRRTSIDELPQLINVLRGDMSLIGPRPHAAAHDDYYGARIPFYGKRFAAKPGLSGLAQVNGSRGETPQIADMERRVRLDLVYIRSASVTTDVRLVVATVREMFFSSTAY